MTALIIGIHVIVCVLLILIILIQAGRGGGLVESLSSVESMFGTKTSTFLTKTTSILAILFFITCLILAFSSARRSQSLLKGKKPAAVKTNKTEATKLPVGNETKKETAQGTNSTTANLETKTLNVTNTTAQQPAQSVPKAE